MEETLQLILLSIIGIFAGFLNVTAGGGSLLTLPFLIFLGLPPAVANGTNRIAILVQNIFATAKFHQFEVIPKGVTIITALPAIAGSVLGAQLAVEIDELLFKRLLAIVMSLILGLIFFNPKVEELNSTPKISGWKKFILVIAFFGIGFYGGFIQGGIGFLFIAVLGFAGYDLVRTNALKVLIILIFTPFALMVFILNNQVDFFRGSILAAGNAVGALLATHVVVERGHKFIRWVVLIAAVGFAVKLFVG